MSAKPETTFIRSVHKHLPVDLYRLKMHNQYNAGAADVWYSGIQSDMWIEYKYIDHIPQSSSIKANVSELQSAWLRDRYHEGRSVHVILGTKLGGIIFSDRSWENPYNHANLTSLILTRKEIADWITLTTTGCHANTQTASKRSNRCQRVL